MNKQLSKQSLPFKSYKPVTPIQRAKQEQSYSYRHSIKSSVVFKASDKIESTRMTTAKMPQERSNKEEKNKQEALNYVKEKQTSEKLQKSINHKDQIISSKNQRVKQLESEANLLKAQIERYRVRIQELTASLEVYRRSKYQMAHRLLYDSICEAEEGYPDIDAMTYEELLELENKIGYVSKGLKQEAIEKIPIMKYKRASSHGEESKCLICQYDFEEGNTLRLIKCKHLFHKDCIDKWLTAEKVCPSCKREV